MRLWLRLRADNTSQTKRIITGVQYWVWQQQSASASLLKFQLFQCLKCLSTNTQGGQSQIGDKLEGNSGAPTFGYWSIFPWWWSRLYVVIFFTFQPTYFCTRSEFVTSFSKESQIGGIIDSIKVGMSILHSAHSHFHFRRQDPDSLIGDAMLHRIEKIWVSIHRIDHCTGSTL